MSNLTAEKIICSHCGFEIHRDHAVRHFGTHVAHSESTCIQLLMAERDRLQRRVAELEIVPDAARKLGELAAAHIILRTALSKITVHRLHKRKTAAGLIAEKALADTQDAAHLSVALGSLTKEAARGKFDVMKVCGAYESGFGHGAAADGLPNPYNAGSSEFEAYQIGVDAGYAESKRGAAHETEAKPCCDIHAAHPGKHRGGCPDETVETLPCGCQPSRTATWIRRQCGCLPSESDHGDPTDI